MGKDLSKDDNIPFVELDDQDVPPVDVADDFRVATSAIDISKFNQTMSFHQFFQMVDNIIRERNVSLKKAYATCPSDVHEYFTLNAMMKEYQQFKEGDKNDEEINPKVSYTILRLLYFVKPVPRVMADEFDIEDTDPSLATIEFPNVEKVNDTNPLDQSVPYIEETLETKPDLQIATALAPANNSAFMKKYRKEFDALKDIKKVPLAAVWNSLPSEMVQGHSYLAHRNGSYIGSNRNNLSVDICLAVLDVYRKLPDYITQVSAKEVKGPFVLEDNYGLMVSSDIAYAQIKNAQKRAGEKGKRETVISKYSELTGYPEESRLLVKKHGGDKYISRLQVAIILNIIEGKKVSKESVALLKHYLENNKSIEQLEKGNAPVSGLQFDKNGMLLPQTENPTVLVDLTKTFKNKGVPEAQPKGADLEMSGAFNRQNRTDSRPAEYYTVFEIGENTHDCLAFG